MSQALTFDDVWKMFQETDRRSKETDRLIKEIALQSKETDLKFQETDRRFKETDLKFQETDRQIKELARQSELRSKELDRRLGQLGGRLGEFVEGLVAPACEILFEQRGIPIHHVSRRVTAKLPGGRFMEIDLLVENTDTLALVEVKSKMTVKDVEEFMEDLTNFREFFPRYADLKVMGAIAAMVIEENVMRFAINQGLFVIVQAGDNVRMANDQNFVPRAW
ncbi:MAG: DUF3782 domain-containing protein [Magnetococcales bacterium]|nr:DUF3782 domain-containing protein [Magnetococcales bacterium]